MVVFCINGIKISARKLRFNEQTYIDLESLTIYYNDKQIKYIEDDQLQTIKALCILNHEYKHIPGERLQIHIDVLKDMISRRFKDE